MVSSERAREAWKQAKQAVAATIRRIVEDEYALQAEQNRRRLEVLLTRGR